MVYARKGPQGEVISLQQEITDEVSRDAEHIASSIFGNVDNQPDLARVSDEQLVATYRRAYQNGDRQFLQAEARRDPNQFLKITDKLGVQKPAPAPVPPPVPAPSPIPMPVPQPMLPAMPAMPPPALAPGPPIAGPQLPNVPAPPVAAPIPPPGLVA